MTSNPTRPFGGNYSQPTPDFSRYTGPSFPPPGSNFYPPNPSIPLTNPYSGSSIGAYPNITFPSGPPLSFQPSFPSSTLPASVTPPGIPSYSRPPSSFNPNPPQGRSGANPPIAPPGSIPAWVTTMQPSSLFNPSITPPGSIPAWITTMQPSSLFNPPSSDYRINNSPSIPSFASQPFSPTVPSFQSMNSFLPRTIGSQAVSSPPNYLGAVSFSPQLPSGRAGLPRTYSCLGAASFLPSRENSWTPPSSSSRRAHFNSDRAVVQWTPGYLSSYGQKPPSVEKDHNFQFTMLRKFEETARFMYQMHASPEKPFARWDTMAVAPVAFKLDSQTTLFVNPLVMADLFQRASLTQIQDVQTQLMQMTRRNELHKPNDRHALPLTSSSAASKSSNAFFRVIEKAAEIGPGYEVTIGKILMEKPIQQWVASFSRISNQLNPVSAIIQHPENRSRSFTVGTVDNPHIGIGFINGIDTFFEQSKKFSEMLSQSANDAIIQSVYNATHGPIADIGRCSLGYARMAAPPVVLLKETWNNFHATHGPDDKFLQFCTSGGATEVKIALLTSPKEVQDRIIVVAWAPACIIPKEICFKSFNYVSKRDFVPYFDIEGLIKYGDQLIRVEPHPEAPFFDHGYGSPTNTELVKFHMQEHLSNLQGATNEF